MRRNSKKLLYMSIGLAAFIVGTVIGISSVDTGHVAGMVTGGALGLSGAVLYAVIIMRVGGK